VFERSWKTLRTLTLIIGVSFAFFAFIEILHTYEVLSNFHPILGYVFLLVLLCLFGYLFVYLACSPCDVLGCPDIVRWQVPLDP